MKIFRRRFIPNEIVDISGDEVVFRDDKKLITRWLPIKPRPDIGSGMSCIYFDKGIKISKIFDKSGNFKHWYCDIIKHEYIKEEDKYIVTDLLVDVVVYPDGHYEVLDLEELDEALKENLISLEVKEEALDKMNSLLDVIKKGEFEECFGEDFKIGYEK